MDVGGIPTNSINASTHFFIEHWVEFTDIPLIYITILLNLCV